MPDKFMNTYAVFLHTDHISNIGATCSAISNQGLPDSGYKTADKPLVGTLR